MADSERAILESGLASLSIPYSDHQITLLLRYVDLIERWNKAYNLTAVRGRENWLVRHLLDSLAVLPFLRGKRVIDVGTGAGLPGIPLAIMQPTTLFSLLDSNGKKTRFLFQVQTQLALSNVTIIDARVEAYRPAKTFDVVISRAFGSLTKLVDICEHLLSNNGCYLAMKGAMVEDDVMTLQQSAADGRLMTSVHALRVPGLDESRCVVELAFMRGQE